MRAKTPSEAEERKRLPLCSGVLDYFPRAMLAVAAASEAGNRQHCPGQPLKWDRAKSADEADALLRHMIDRGAVDSDGVRHSAKVAWRALALLEKEIELGSDTDCNTADGGGSADGLYGGDRGGDRPAVDKPAHGIERWMAEWLAADSERWSIVPAGALRFCESARDVRGYIAEAIINELAPFAPKQKSETSNAD